MRLTAMLSKIAKYSTDYSNLPESYIKRAMRQVYWEAPKDLPQYLPVTLEKKKFRYTMNRPWTEEFRRQNLSRRKKVFVEPLKEWTFFRGDRVEVLVGKDKGKIGLVSQIIEERNWVVVEGLNVHYRWIGKTDDYPGTVIQSEAPLLVTNEVALVDPTDEKGTKVEWRYTEQGEKVRVSKRTGHIIPVPISASETIDFKTKAGYPEQEKDTRAADISEHTYIPQSKTFEMDLMEHYRLE
ncbi:large ribosomal subunit protein uL24m-like [Daphnia carinata]|uniref:large ribosomal subunit protein uL24m-like n=1 Tax=Daphnia carinata TaxID=120202 RepID=UPI00257E0FA6|nr:large ribosomal subunit protein uL24m-like [Daphnia carinata]